METGQRGKGMLYIQYHAAKNSEKEKAPGTPLPWLRGPNGTHWKEWLWLRLIRVCMETFSMRVTRFFGYLVWATAGWSVGAGKESVWGFSEDGVVDST